MQRRRLALLALLARLIGARDGYELWSETGERHMDDVFAIQDEIARSIVTRLRGRLAGDAGDLPPAAPDVTDTEAYNLYLRGRYEWHKRTEQGLRAAAEYFARAVERAPGYARAHAGLGDAHAVLGFYDYLPPADAFPNAARSAERALQLDPSLASAHATLGYVALYYDWDFTRSEEEFRRTIDLDPGYSTPAVVRELPHRDGSVRRGSERDARGAGPGSAVTHRQRRAGLGPLPCGRLRGRGRTVYAHAGARPGVRARAPLARQVARAARPFR